MAVNRVTMEYYRIIDDYPKEQWENEAQKLPEALAFEGHNMTLKDKLLQLIEFKLRSLPNDDKPAPEYLTGNYR